MYDFNGIRIFFKDDFVSYSWHKDVLTGFVDLEECGKRGLKIVPREMTWHIDGDYEYRDLYHPWDSLPSSFTGIAFKLYQSSLTRPIPCIEIKASPAKITQGHNVYGSEKLELGVRSIFQALKHALPHFADMLDFQSAEFFRIDSTYSVQLPDNDAQLSVLRAMSNVSNRYLRPSRSGNYESTIYFNKSSQDSPSSGRSTVICIYSKLDEVEYQLESLKKQAKKERTHQFDTVIKNLSSEELQGFAKNRLRFEARCMKRFFVKHNLPVNVYELITYVDEFEKENGEGSFCRWLWNTAMKDLLDAINGQEIECIHDGKVKRLLHTAYDSVNAKGRINTSKAVRLFGVYSRLVHEGYERVKSTMGRSSFYNAVNDLKAIGFAKAQLQNLNKSERTPMVNLLKFDFNAQRPESYTEPKMPCSDLTYAEFLSSLQGNTVLHEELRDPDVRLAEKLAEYGVTSRLIPGLKSGRPVRLNKYEELTLAFWTDGSVNIVVNDVSEPCYIPPADVGDNIYGIRG